MTVLTRSILHRILLSRWESVYAALGLGAVGFSVPIADPLRLKVSVPEGMTAPETISVVYEGQAYTIPIESVPALPLLFPR